MRVSRRLSSYRVFSSEEITTRQWLSSSKNAYFSSTGTGLRSGYCGFMMSPLLLSSSVNKGRISTFFFSKVHAQHKTLQHPVTHQELLLVSLSTPPVAVVADTDHLEWHQSDKLVPNLLPLGACASY